MALAPGTPAPDFKLFNTDKKEFTLDSFKGHNLIIHFFPAAFTGVCTAQMCTNRDDLGYYNNLNATVVSVSADMPFSLGAYKKLHEINFDMLSDYNRDMIKAYNMLLTNFSVGHYEVARRGVVLIDKEGVVRYSEATPTPGDQVNFEALKEALSKLN